MVSPLASMAIVSASSAGCQASSSITMPFSRRLERVSRTTARERLPRRSILTRPAASTPSLSQAVTLIPPPDFSSGT